jgi:hypothetical protein
MASRHVPPLVARPLMEGPKNALRVMNEDMMSIATLHPIEMRKIITKYFKMTVGELNFAKQDPLISVIEIMVIDFMQEVLQKQDTAKFQMLLDRCIGKAVDIKEIHTHNHDMAQLKEKLAAIPAEVVTNYLKGVKDAPQEKQKP